LKSSSETGGDRPGKKNENSAEKAEDALIDEFSNRYASLTVEELKEIQGDDSKTVSLLLISPFFI